MKTLKISNLISIALILLAFAIAIIIGIITGLTFPEGVPVVFMLAIGTVTLSIPITIISLISAYKLKIISIGYVVFSIASSCIIAGAGWIVIPFMLNRDIKLFFSEQQELHRAPNGSC